MPNQLFYPKTAFRLNGANPDNVFNPAPQNYIKTYDVNAVIGLDITLDAGQDILADGVGVGDVIYVPNGPAIGSRSIITAITSTTKFSVTASPGCAGGGGGGGGGRPGAVAGGGAVGVYKNTPHAGILMCCGAADKTDVFEFADLQWDRTSANSGLIGVHTWSGGMGSYWIDSILPIQTVALLKNTTISSNGIIYITYN